MAKIFEKLILGGLHEKHEVQRGIWVPTQHLLWDQGKPRKILIELAGRRTFRMQTEVLRLSILSFRTTRTAQKTKNPRADTDRKSDVMIRISLKNRS
jgi:hypothetical protein